MSDLTEVPKIDARRMALIDELLKGKGVREACGAAGVTRETAERWMGMLPFRDEMAKRRRSTLEVYVTRAMILATLGQTTLTEVMLDPKADPDTRVRAAIAALNSADRLAQHPSVNPDGTGQYRPMFILPDNAKVAVLVDGRVTLPQELEVPLSLPAPEPDVPEEEP